MIEEAQSTVLYNERSYMEYYTGALTLVLVLVGVALMSFGLYHIRPLRKAVERWIEE